MEPTTIRLPAETLAELDSEYGDYGYRTRADYIRDIIAHREPPYETTPATGDYEVATTDELDRLRERVGELEHIVSELRDDRRDETVSDVVEFVRMRQPVSKREIIDAFEEEWSAKEIKGESWWDRHGRAELKESGMEFVRNKGWLDPETET